MALVLALRGQVPSLSELPPGVSSWLYLGEGAAARIELERSISGRLERISTADFLQRHAAALRRPYIDEIGSLSLLNDSPEWWASELAAKNSYTHLFGRLCALAVARELLGSGLDDCLAVCSTPALLAEVEAATATAGVETLRIDAPPPVTKPHARDILIERLVGGFAPRLPLPLLNRAVRVRPWIRPTLERSHTFRRTVLASLGAATETLSGPGTALLFTWVDDRNVTADGAYADPHFGWLPEALRGRGYRLAFLPRFLRTTGFADLAGRLLGTGEHFLFPELLLDEAVLRRCRNTARAFSPDIPDASGVSGVPFAQLAREHVEEYRNAQAANLVYRPLVEALGRAGVQPELLLHTFEGHAWEQVLAGAVHTYLPNTRLVGFDNLNLTRFALARCPAAAELAVRPLPDRIVTNGPTARDELVAGGMPERIVVAGCGIRHVHLPRTGAKEPAGATERTRVLVATDPSLDRSAELVVKAVEAFGSDEAWELVVKCHPLLGRAAVEAFVAKTTGSSGIFDDRPIRELLPGAGLMLYAYSSVCYEALAAGVPPVFVRVETDLDLDQLEPFAGVRWTARTPQALRDAASAILDLSPAERERWLQRAHEAVDAALAPVGPDCVEAFLP